MNKLILILLSFFFMVSCSTENLIVEEGRAVIVDKCHVDNLTNRFKCVVIGEYIVKNDVLVKNK